MTANFPSALLRIDSVIHRRGRSRPKIYADIAVGLMPPPIRMGHRMAAWPDYEIEALNAAEVRGATEAELRALVRQQVAQRTNAVTEAA